MRKKNIYKHTCIDTEMHNTYIVYKHTNMYVTALYSNQHRLIFLKTLNLVNIEVHSKGMLHLHIIFSQWILAGYDDLVKANGAANAVFLFLIRRRPHSLLHLVFTFQSHAVWPMQHLTFQQWMEFVLLVLQRSR